MNKVIELIKFLTISVKAHLMRNVLCPTWNRKDLLSFPVLRANGEILNFSSPHFITFPSTIVTGSNISSLARILLQIFMLIVIYFRVCLLGRPWWWENINNLSQNIIIGRKMWRWRKVNFAASNGNFKFNNFLNFLRRFQGFIWLNFLSERKKMSMNS